MSEDETFKVTDRRGRGEPSASAAPHSSDPSRGPSDSDRTGGTEPTDLPEGAVPSGLGGLLMMFASSALVSLGAAPDSEANESRLDLAQAQAAIDMLLMLRDKTRGNRTEQESRLLENILYDLQMRFVHAARSRPTV